MALFFTRRTYNASTKKFTHNVAQRTRYVKIDAFSADNSVAKGGIISQEDWLRLVRAEGGDEEILIFVHGFNTTQKDVLNRLRVIERGVRAASFRGAVVAFDWPSDGSIHAYDNDVRDAKKVARHFVADGVLPLLGMPSRPKVHALAHSMGGLVVLRGFSDFGDGGGRWELDQIAFVAGDVKQRVFEKGAWASLVLKRRSNRFTNYFSTQDKVLQLSQVAAGGRKRVGQAGMPALTEAVHLDMYCDKQYERDVPQNRRRLTLSHTWWFESDAFYKDLVLTLAGKPADKIPTRAKTDRGRWGLLA